MSQVLYRKYRPRSFGEIIGQEHVVTTLQNAIRAQDIAHAYLFSGPRGTGKTTMARVFTKTINCNNSKSSDDVCLKCLVCDEIEKGNFIDLIEIDAASNRGIDDIRELKQSVRISPSIGKYKVYLVDEAHMLTKEASNALLKMLEEPPSHSIFILATTEPHKLLPTIISRTQRFDFHFLTAQEIAFRLRDLLKRENKELEDTVINLIVAASGGSMRDAESILGKVLSLGSPKEKEVRELLGIVDLREVTNFINLIIESNKEGALNYINDLTQRGGDLEQFIINALEYMRKLLYLKLSPSSKKLLESQLTKEEMKNAQNQIEQLTEKNIYSIIKEFIEALNNIKYSPVPQLPLELAIVNLLKKD